MQPTRPSHSIKAEPCSTAHLQLASPDTLPAAEPPITPAFAATGQPPTLAAQRLEHQLHQQLSRHPARPTRAPALRPVSHTTRKAFAVRVNIALIQHFLSCGVKVDSIGLRPLIDSLENLLLDRRATAPQRPHPHPHPAR